MPSFKLRHPHVPANHVSPLCGVRVGVLSEKILLGQTSFTQCLEDLNGREKTVKHAEKHQAANLGKEALPNPSLVSHAYAPHAAEGVCGTCTPLNGAAQQLCAAISVQTGLQTSVKKSDREAAKACCFRTCVCLATSLEACACTIKGFRKQAERPVQVCKRP
eukprot:5277795-Pleurochrysis_carterae.AAC.2